jgi:hypothetical protein
LARPRKALAQYIKDRLRFAEYLKRHGIRPLPACHANAKGPDHDPIYTTACAEPPAEIRSIKNRGFLTQKQRSLK